MTSKQALRKLFRDGWTKVRKSGGHQIMKKDGKRISVPVHGGEMKGWMTKRCKSLLPKAS